MPFYNYDFILTVIVCYCYKGTFPKAVKMKTKRTRFNVGSTYSLIFLNKNESLFFPTKHIPVSSEPFWRWTRKNKKEEMKDRFTFVPLPLHNNTLANRCICMPTFSTFAPIWYILPSLSLQERRKRALPNFSPSKILKLDDPLHTWKVGVISIRNSWDKHESTVTGSLRQISFCHFDTFISIRFCEDWHDRRQDPREIKKFSLPGREKQIFRRANFSSPGELLLHFT